MRELKTTTKQSYTGWRTRLIRHANHASSYDVTCQDLQKFFRSLTTHNPKTVRVAWAAIVKHYRRPDIWTRMPADFQDAFESTMAACYPRRVPRSLPLTETTLLSPDDVERWIHAIDAPAVHLLAWLCYHPGLSAQAVVGLRLSDAQWLPIPPHLRAWWLAHVRLLRTQRATWLFPNGRGGHLSPASLYKAIGQAKRRAGLTVSGAGVRVIRTVGIVRLLREENRDPNVVMQQCGIQTRQAFLPYLKLAGLV